MPTLPPAPPPVKPAASYLGVGVVDLPPVAALAPSSADARLIGMDTVAVVPSIDFAEWAADGSHAWAAPGRDDDALPLIDAIERDADAFRSGGTPLALLYAEALRRLATLADAVDATRPGDVYDRADAADRIRALDAARVAYAAGYGAGALSEIDSACR